MHLTLRRTHQQRVPDDEKLSHVTIDGRLPRLAAVGCVVAREGVPATGDERGPRLDEFVDTVGRRLPAHVLCGVDELPFRAADAGLPGRRRFQHVLQPNAQQLLRSDQVQDLVVRNDAA